MKWGTFTFICISIHTHKGKKEYLKSSKYFVEIAAKNLQLYGVVQEVRQIIAFPVKRFPVKEKHLRAAIPEAHTVQL